MSKRKSNAPIKLQLKSAKFTEQFMLPDQDIPDVRYNHKKFSAKKSSDVVETSILSGTKEPTNEQTSSQDELPSPSSPLNLSLPRRNAASPPKAAPSLNRQGALPPIIINLSSKLDINHFRSIPINIFPGIINMFIPPSIDLPPPRPLPVSVGFSRQVPIRPKYSSGGPSLRQLRPSSHEPGYWPRPASQPMISVRPLATLQKESSLPLQQFLLPTRIADSYEPPSVRLNLPSGGVPREVSKSFTTGSSSSNVLYPMSTSSVTRMLCPAKSGTNVTLQHKSLPETFMYKMPNGVVKMVKPCEPPTGVPIIEDKTVREQQPIKQPLQPQPQQLKSEITQLQARISQPTYLPTSSQPQHLTSLPSQPPHLQSDMSQLSASFPQVGHRQSDLAGRSIMGITSLIQLRPQHELKATTHKLTAPREPPPSMVHGAATTCAEPEDKEEEEVDPTNEFLSKISRVNVAKKTTQKRSKTIPARKVMQTRGNKAVEKLDARTTGRGEDRESISAAVSQTTTVPFSFSTTLPYWPIKANLPLTPNSAAATKPNLSPLIKLGGNTFNNQAAKSTVLVPGSKDPLDSTPIPGLIKLTGRGGKKKIVLQPVKTVPNAVQQKVQKLLSTNAIPTEEEKSGSLRNILQGPSGSIVNKKENFLPTSFSVVSCTMPLGAAVSSRSIEFVTANSNCNEFAIASDKFTTAVSSCTQVGPAISDSKHFVQIVSDNMVQHVTTASSSTMQTGTAGISYPLPTSSMGYVLDPYRSGTSESTVVVSNSWSQPSSTASIMDAVVVVVGSTILDPPATTPSTSCIATILDSGAYISSSGALGSPSYISSCNMFLDSPRVLYSNSLDSPPVISSPGRYRSYEESTLHLLNSPDKIDTPASRQFSTTASRQFSTTSTDTAPASRQFPTTPSTDTVLSSGQFSTSSTDTAVILNQEVRAILSLGKDKDFLERKKKNRWLDVTPAERVVVKSPKRNLIKDPGNKGKWRFDREISLEAHFTPLVPIPLSKHKIVFDKIHSKEIKEVLKHEPGVDPDDPPDQTPEGVSHQPDPAPATKTVANLSTVNSPRKVQDPVVKRAPAPLTDRGPQPPPVNVNTSPNGSVQYKKMTVDLSSSIIQTTKHKYKCSWCTLFFTSLTAIKDHSCTPRFQCEDCDPPRQYGSKKELAAHLRMHPYAKHPCTFCKYISESRTHLLRHVKRVHANTEIAGAATNPADPSLEANERSGTPSAGGEESRHDQFMNSSLAAHVGGMVRHLETRLHQDHGQAAGEAAQPEPVVPEVSSVFDISTDTEENLFGGEPLLGDICSSSGGTPNRRKDTEPSDEIENHDLPDDVIVPTLSRGHLHIVAMDPSDEIELNYSILERAASSSPIAAGEDLENEDLEKRHLLSDSTINFTDNVDTQQESSIDIEMEVNGQTAEQSTGLKTEVDTQPDTQAENCTDTTFPCPHCALQFRTAVRCSHHSKVCPKNLNTSRSRKIRLEEMLKEEKEILVSKELCVKCCRNIYKESSLEKHLYNCRGNYLRNTRVFCPFCRSPRRFFQTESMLKGHVSLVHGNNTAIKKWRSLQKTRIREERSEFGEPY